MLNTGSGGLFGTPQTGGLGGGLNVGTGLGGLGASTGGGLFGRQTGGLFASAGGTQTVTGGTGLFGNTPSSQGGGLFTGGLGGGTTGGLFQSPQGGLGTQQKTGYAGGLFGTPSLGVTGGTGSVLGGGLFGGQNQQTSTAGGLFGKTQTPAGGLGGGLGIGSGFFGNRQVALGTATSGTVVKFEPVKGTDTVSKNGITQNVNTHLHCITGMRQYPGKSLEELRFEDYSAGRKSATTGVLGVGTTGGALFGNQSTGTGLTGGGLTGGGLFGGQNQLKTLSGGLGGGLFGQQNQQQQLLGGLGTSTSVGLFGNQQKLGGGLFSTGNQAKLGGGLGTGLGGTTGGLFNQQQSSQAGGMGGLFGNQTSTGGGLFNQTGTGLGGLGGTQTQLGGGIFGRSNTSGLGQTGGLGGGLGGLSGGLGGGLGVLQSSQSGLFNKSSTGLGGIKPQTGQLGLGLGLGGTGLGTGLNTNLGLGTGLGTGLGVLGQNKLGMGNTLMSGTGFGTQLGGLNQNPNLGQNTLQNLNQQQQEEQLKQQLEILADSPFGDSPLFRNAITDAAKNKNKDSSTPISAKPSPHTPHYKLNMRPSSKFKPISLSSPSRHQDKSRLFEGLEESQLSYSSMSANSSLNSGETFIPRKNIKKLNIKPKPSQPRTWPDSTTPSLEDCPQSNSIPVTPLSGSSSIQATPTSNSNMTPSPGKAAAFSVTPPSARASTANDTSIESPDITLGTAMRKPIARRPTPTSSPAARPHSSPLAQTSVSSRHTSAGGASSRRESTDDHSPFDQKGLTLTREGLKRSPILHKESRPCGITLTKPSYYTIPPLEELDNMADDGECSVEGFTVGRSGFGEVHFPGRTDVYGLDLDEIVIINTKEMIVYPDDSGSHKPPEGSELNKEAIVKLEGNWPVDKATREPIKDAERLKRMGYENKLKRSTEKIGAEYIDYNPDTGTCIFKVEHFSKYKLADDDSEDEGGDGQGKAEVGVVKKLKIVQPNEKSVSLPKAPIIVQQQQEKQVLPSSQSAPQERFRLDGDEEMSDVERYEDANGDMMSLAPHPSSVVPPAQQIVGLNTHHIQIMKASFFTNERVSEERTPPALVQQQGSCSVGRLTFAPSSRPGSRTGSRVDDHLQSSLMRPPSRSGVSTGGASGVFQSPATAGSLLRSGIQTTSMRPNISQPSSARATPVPSPFQSLRGGTDPRPLGSEFPPSSSMDPLSAGAGFVGLTSTSSRRTLPTPQTALSSLQAQSAVLMAKRNLHVMVPYQKSLVKGREKTICDHGLFMGRSFRIGWGPNWTLAHSGCQLSRSSSTNRSAIGGAIFSSLRPADRSHSGTENEGHPIKVVLEQVHATKSLGMDADSYLTNFEAFLQTQLEHTQFTDRDGCPDGPLLCVPCSGTTLLHELTDVSQAQPPPGLGDADTATLLQLRRVLQLAVALWGNLPADCDQDQESYEHQMSRRRSVYQWLKQTNKPVTEREVIANSNDSEDDYLSSLFSLVCGQQLSAACHLAQKHRDHKLALILSQATHNTRTNRAFVSQQLDEWARHKTYKYINPIRFKLYVLLAGQMTWTSNDAKTTFNVCSDLDWKRALSLHLCYSCDPTAPIRDILDVYVNAFQGQDAYAPPPRPPYCEVGGRGGRAPQEQHVFDTCYHLLQLYCHRDHSLELTLQPAASTQFQLDHRTSWLLWSILTALDYTHMHPTKMIQLLSCFSAQLERCEMWEWSVFVLLHIPDTALSKSAIQQVFALNCSPGEELSDKEKFVIDGLRVPKEWVYSAKAERASYEHWFVMKAHHLLEAELWNDAHDVIMEHIAVDAIINGDAVDLLQTLEKLSEPSRCGQIQGWQFGGSVFLDFLHISDRLQLLAHSSEEPSDYELGELHVGLVKLAQRIGQVSCNTPEDVLCQSEMAKQTATFTKIILTLKAERESIADSDLFIQRELLPTLVQLPMPPDYAVTEYSTLIQSKIKELAQLPY